MTDYTLIRTRRKTIAIRITKEGAVEVRAPHQAPKSDIGRFVRSKQAWIDKHCAQRLQAAESKAAFALKYGSTVPLLGEEYPVSAREGDIAGFDGDTFYLPPDLSPQGIKHVVVYTYTALAKKVLEDKTDTYARRMGVAPSAVKVNGAKTRWGSCSGKNSLNFSWRLMMADEDAVDYVVVHELAHMKEHNHSARFWAVVAAILPDYKQRQVRLKELQNRLAGEDWD